MASVGPLQCPVGRSESSRPAAPRTKHQECGPGGAAQGRRSGRSGPRSATPALGVGQVVAAGVEQLQLLGDHPRLGQLPARVTDRQRQLRAGPLPLVRRREAAAQQPLAAVERVLTMATPAEALLLPAASDIVDCGLSETHDVEGIKHPDCLRQAGAQPGRVAPERVQRGGRDLRPPGWVLRCDQCETTLPLRPGTTSSSCARSRSGPRASPRRR